VNIEGCRKRIRPRQRLPEAYNPETCRAGNIGSAQAHKPQVIMSQPRPNLLRHNVAGNVRIGSRPNRMCPARRHRRRPTFEIATHSRWGEAKVDSANLGLKVAENRERQPTNVDFPHRRSLNDHESNASRIFVVRSAKLKGFKIRETPLSSLPAWIMVSSVYPVVSTTFSSGRR
jgi:hypothetical protein